MKPTKLFYYRVQGANSQAQMRVGSILCDMSCVSKTNRIPHHHPGLLEKGAVITASGYVNQWSKGKGHTHISREKTQAKQVRQSSLPSLDSDPARSGLFQIETSSTVLMSTSNWIHRSFTSLTFSLITVTHWILIQFSLHKGTMDLSANGNRRIN